MGKLRMALAVLIVVVLVGSLAWLALGEDGASSHAVTRLPDAGSKAHPSGAETHAALPEERRHVASDAGSGRRSAHSDAPAWSVYPERDDHSLAASIHRCFGPGHEKTERAEARQVLAALPASEVVPVLLDVIARRDDEWLNADVLLFVAEFEERALPWLEEIAAYADDTWSLALGATLVMKNVGDLGLPHLERATRSGDPRIRARALWAMGEFRGRDARVLGAAISALADADSDVRHRAMKITAARREDVSRSLDALTSLLHADEKTSVRAIGALGSMGDAAAPAAPALVALLNSDSTVVRHQAAYELGRIPSVAAVSVPTIRALIESNPAEFGQRAGAIARLSLEAYLDGCGAESAAVRAAFIARAGAALSAHPGARPSIVGALARALDDDESTVRSAALSCVRRLGGDRAALEPALTRLAADERMSSREREWARGLIGRVDPDVARERLLARIIASPPAERAALVRRMSELGVASREDLQALLTRGDLESGTKSAIQSALGQVE